MSVNIQFWSWINIPKDHNCHESHDWRENWWNPWGSKGSIRCRVWPPLHRWRSALPAESKLQNVSFFSHWAVFLVWFQTNQCSATVASMSFGNKCYNLAMTAGYKTSKQYHGWEFLCCTLQSWHASIKVRWLKW